MTYDPKTVERLAKECNFIAQVMRVTGTFPTGQSVCDEAATLLREQEAEIERLRERLRKTTEELLNLPDPLAEQARLPGHSEDNNLAWTDLPPA